MSALMHVAVNGWFWDQPNTGQRPVPAPPAASEWPSRPGFAHDARSAAALRPMRTICPTTSSLVTTQRQRRQSRQSVVRAAHFPAVWSAQVEADIAHVPYWGPPLTSPARLVTSVLDVIPLAIPDYSRGFRARLYTSLVSAAARGSAHILTLSEASKSTSSII